MTCKNCSLWAKIPGARNGECRMGPPTPVLIGMSGGAKGLVGVPQGGAQPIFAFVVPQAPAEYGCACFRPRPTPEGDV